jgi:molecular chaperone DnaJ
VVGYSPEDLFGGIDFQDLFHGFGFDFGSGLFDHFFPASAWAFAG